MLSGRNLQNCQNQPFQLHFQRSSTNGITKTTAWRSIRWPDHLLYKRMSDKATSGSPLPVCECAGHDPNCGQRDKGLKCNTNTNQKQNINMQRLASYMNFIGSILSQQHESLLVRLTNSQNRGLENNSKHRKKYKTATKEWLLLLFFWC